MDLQIQLLGDGIVAAGYTGHCSIAERLSAKQRISTAAARAGSRRVLIDLSRATIEPYGPKDSLQVVRRVATDPVFGRLAYIRRAGQNDFVAQVLTTAHGTQQFRQFDDASAAVAWLSA